MYLVDYLFPGCWFARTAISPEWFFAGGESEPENQSIVHTVGSVLHYRYASSPKENKWMQGEMKATQGSNFQLTLDVSHQSWQAQWQHGCVDQLGLSPVGNLLLKGLVATTFIM